MNIRGWLFLQGALLPSAALVSLVAIGGALFRHALLHSVDESLTGLAAVGAVSLFDGLENPHLHGTGPSFRGQVEAYMPSRAVYGPDGNMVVGQRTLVELPPRIRPLRELGPPLLRTSTIDGEEVRQLRAAVAAPDGKVYTLVLRSSLARLDRTVGTYQRVLGSGALLLSLAFILIQARSSRWWAERIRNMIRHTRRLEAGDLSSRPDPDPHADEIGELVAAITRASERLEKARRAQDRLVADAAHELRAPLAAIRAEIDVTLRRPRDKAALREALETVRDEVDRLDTLSTRLLDLARRAAGAWLVEPTDLPIVVAEAVEAHRAAAELGQVSLRFEGPRSLVAVVDREAVRQAVDNLVGNAVKFSPPHGEVLVSLRREAGRFALEVRDQGPGVPADEQEAVFEPFRRLDARMPGSGLGLAIVRDVATRHHGWARIEPSERGTRVRFEAPLSAVG